jgi:hypothetical protein
VARDAATITLVLMVAQAWNLVVQFPSVELQETKLQVLESVTDELQDLDVNPQPWKSKH